VWPFISKNSGRLCARCMQELLDAPCRMQTHLQTVSATTSMSISAPKTKSTLDALETETRLFSNCQVGSLLLHFGTSVNHRGIGHGSLSGKLPSSKLEVTFPFVWALTALFAMDADLPLATVEPLFFGAAQSVLGAPSQGHNFFSSHRDSQEALLIDARCQTLGCVGNFEAGKVLEIWKAVCSSPNSERTITVQATSNITCKSSFWRIFAKILFLCEVLIKLSNCTGALWSTLLWFMTSCKCQPSLLLFG